MKDNLLTIHKMIEYCEDIETIMNKYETNYEYCTDNLSNIPATCV